MVLAVNVVVTIRRGGLSFEYIQCLCLSNTCLVILLSVGLLLLVLVLVLLLLLLVRCLLVVLGTRRFSEPSIVWRF